MNVKMQFLRLKIPQFFFSKWAKFQNVSYYFFLFIELLQFNFIDICYVDTFAHMVDLSKILNK